MENGNEWMNSKESINDELTQIDNQVDLREKDVESQRLLLSVDLKNGDTINRREAKTKHVF